MKDDPLTISSIKSIENSSYIMKEKKINIFN